MKHVTSFFFAAFLAMTAVCPALATWTFTGDTSASSTNPIITDGDWTVVLNGKNKVKYSAHPNPDVGLLDLTGVYDDTGLTITMVDYRGFLSKTDITGIILPESCTGFGEEAFYRAGNLETIVLSSQTGPITTKNVFAICTKLKSVTYTGVTAEDGVIRLPSTVTRLANSAFQMWDGNTTITRVIAPGVTTISKYSLYKIYNLQSVEFSPNFSGFDSEGGAYAFGESGKNGSFTISPAKWKSPVSNLTGEDIFFNGGVAGELDWSEGTFTEVPYRIFCGDTKLDCVTLPKTVTSIKKQAFVNMKKGFVLRFLGDVPTLADTADSIWQTSFWGSNGRYRIVVDPVAYPDWVDVDKGFTALTDADRNLSDYPSDLPEGEVLGFTTVGLTGSVSSARRHWLIKYVDHTKYTVTWKNGDANFATTQGEKVELVVAPDGTPAKTSTDEFDYTFIGWNTDASATTALDISTATITGSMTYYAIFSASTRAYTITWQMDDGTTIGASNVLYGETPTHADVSKASTAEHSYEFLGWSTDGENVLAVLPSVTGPATYIAVFAEHDATTTATVSWFDEDGMTPLVPAQTTVTKGLQPTHEAPTKAPTIDTAYTFDGWVEIGGSGAVIAPANLPAVSGDISYRAHYASSVRQYTVTFVDWDGSIIKTAELDYLTAAADVAAERPADPSRAADAEYTYAFTEWSPAFAVVSGDAVYTAQYAATANTYGATFVDGIDDSIIEGPTSYVYGAAVTAPAAPEHYGFIFSAWNPEVTTMPAADTVYTAVYSTNRFTITWVNGDATTTANYYYLAPMDATKAPEPKKTNTAKESYTFVEWSPAFEPVQSNTTYTAVFTRTILKTMKLAFKSASYDRETGAITVLATILNPGQDGETTGVIVTEPATDGNIVTIEDGTNVTATIVGPLTGKGYEWTLTVTQLASGVAETVALKGRTWARRRNGWFSEGDVSWTDDEYEPGTSSSVQQQVRVKGTLGFGGMLPNSLPDATVAKLGFAACQKNAGDPASYFAWDGAAWVRLYGAMPAASTTVKILGVVDFARKNGPAVAWYADGFQLTTESGDWEVPLAGGTKLTSFGLVGDLSVDSLSGDYDIGGQGFTLLVR